MLSHGFRASAEEPRLQGPGRLHPWSGPALLTERPGLTPGHQVGSLPGVTAQVQGLGSPTAGASLVTFVFKDGSFKLSFDHIKNQSPAGPGGSRL